MRHAEIVPSSSPVNVSTLRRGARWWSNHGVKLSWIYLRFFWRGKWSRLRHLLIFQTDNSCGVWLQKQSFLKCLTTTSVDWVVFSRSSRPCLIQMALQIGHAFSLFGAITASDVFQDLIANWMLEVWSAFKFLFKVFHGSVGNQTSMEPLFLYILDLPPGPQDAIVTSRIILHF